MKIDAHAHMRREEGFLDELYTQCQTMGIDRACLNGLARVYPEYADNADVIEAARRCPPRLLSRLVTTDYETATPMRADGGFGLVLRSEATSESSTRPPYSYAVTQISNARSDGIGEGCLHTPPNEASILAAT